MNHGVAIAGVILVFCLCLYYGVRIMINRFLLEEQLREEADPEESGFDQGMTRSQRDGLE